jgi:hypothetical protein
MCDFVALATAAESAMGIPSGAFMCAYDANRRAANDVVLESDTLATLVIEVAGNGACARTADERLRT